MDEVVTFRTRDWLGRGVTRRALAGPGYRSPYRGVHVTADKADDIRTGRAVVLSLFPAGTSLSHQSAARAWRFPVDLPPGEAVTVTLPAHRRQVRGVSCTVAELAPHEVELRAGARMTSPLRTYRDLARRLPLVDLVAIGDHLARRHGVAPERLREATAEWTGAGVRAAREAAGFVRPRVDSGPETRVRMLLVLAGLPEPEVGLVLRDDAGEPRRQHDLAYREARIAIEYDGRQHIEREERWQRDIDRRESMDRAGWRAIVLTARDLYREPDRVLTRVRDLMVERGMSPPTITDRWRSYFAVKP